MSDLTPELDALVGLLFWLSRIVKWTASDRFRLQRPRHLWRHGHDIPRKIQEQQARDTAGREHG